MLANLASLAYNAAYSIGLRGAAGITTFTAAAGTTFTVPHNVAGSGSANSTGVTISTTGGTGVFNGVTGWTNSSGTNNVQALAWQAPSTGTTSTGGSRAINLRFNQFTLIGSCSSCNTVIIPTSNGFGLGGVFPATGLALNTGVTNLSALRMGTLYEQSAVTAGTISISVEAISNGRYTIKLDADLGYHVANYTSYFARHH